MCTVWELPPSAHPMPPPLKRISGWIRRKLHVWATNFGMSLIRMKTGSLPFILHS